MQSADVDSQTHTATELPCAELLNHVGSHELPVPIVLHLLAWHLPLNDPQIAAQRCSGHQQHVSQTSRACDECSKDLICEQQGLQQRVQCQRSLLLPYTLLSEE